MCHHYDGSCACSLPALPTWATSVDEEAEPIVAHTSAQPLATRATSSQCPCPPPGRKPNPFLPAASLPSLAVGAWSLLALLPHLLVRCPRNPAAQRRPSGPRPPPSPCVLSLFASEKQAPTRHCCMPQLGESFQHVLVLCRSLLAALDLPPIGQRPPLGNHLLLAGPTRKMQPSLLHAIRLLVLSARSRCWPGHKADTPVPSWHRP